jgi:hypothetical protein
MSEPATEPVEMAEFQAEVFARLEAIETRLTELTNGYNATGENVAWIVANVQGIFQVFNNPEMMSKLMGQVMGGAKHE